MPKPMPKRNKPKKRNLMTTIAVLSVVAALLVFANLVRESKMPMLLTSKSEACIVCHTMNTHYATWQRSSHREYTVCIDCHLPAEGFVDKWMAKSRDGMRHSWAMTFKTYGANLRITDDAAGRIQTNCIRCHENVVSQMLENSGRYARQKDPTVPMGRRCWECHRDVPHGLNRNLAATRGNYPAASVAR